MIHACKFYRHPSILPPLFLNPVSPSPPIKLVSLRPFHHRCHHHHHLHRISIFHTSKSVAAVTANTRKIDSFYTKYVISRDSLGVSEKFCRPLTNLGFSRPSLVQVANGNYPAIKSNNLGSSSLLSRFAAVKCFSAKKKAPQKRKSSKKTEMEDEKDAFFVVRKGDIVGVYKSLSECQAQVSSSISDPPVSVYKGYSLPKDAEEYLSSRGLHNALYTVKASHLKDDLFGTLVPCPFQEPVASWGETSNVDLPLKRPNEGAVGLLPTSSGPLNKLQKLDRVPLSTMETCILHFDGASKGNPGQAGAGAVLRTRSGSLICRIRQGLGIATCNAAEYRAVILGLKKALEMGYTSIQVQGDSKLVCMQLQGLWKVKHQGMSDLYAETLKLKEQFSSFEISHVLRELNSDADAQANFGVCLADGEVQEKDDMNLQVLHDVTKHRFHETAEGYKDIKYPGFVRMMSQSTVFQQYLNCILL